MARGRAGGGTCAHRAGQMAMAGSRKGAGSKGGAELPRGRVVQPAPLKVMQPVPLKGDPYFPQPIPGESQRRFEAFTVRGRPFIATTRASESSNRLHGQPRQQQEVVRQVQSTSAPDICKVSRAPAVYRARRTRRALRVHRSLRPLRIRPAHPQSSLAACCAFGTRTRSGGRKRSFAAYW